MPYTVEDFKGQMDPDQTIYSYKNIDLLKDFFNNIVVDFAGIDQTKQWILKLWTNLQQKDSQNQSFLFIKNLSNSEFNSKDPKVQAETLRDRIIFFTNLANNIGARLKETSNALQGYLIDDGKLNAKTKDKTTKDFFNYLVEKINDETKEISSYLKSNNDVKEKYNKMLNNNPKDPYGKNGGGGGYHESEDERKRRLEKRIRIWNEKGEKLDKDFGKLFGEKDKDEKDESLFGEIENEIDSDEEELFTNEKFVEKFRKKFLYKLVKSKVFGSGGKKNALFSLFRKGSDFNKRYEKIDDDFQHLKKYCKTIKESNKKLSDWEKKMSELESEKINNDEIENIFNNVKRYSYFEKINFYRILLGNFLSYKKALDVFVPSSGHKSEDDGDEDDSDEEKDVEDDKEDEEKVESSENIIDSLKKDVAKVSQVAMKELKSSTEKFNSTEVPVKKDNKTPKVDDESKFGDDPVVGDETTDSLYKNLSEGEKLNLNYKQKRALGLFLVTTATNINFLLNNGSEEGKIVLENQENEYNVLKYIINTVRDFNNSKSKIVKDIFEKFKNTDNEYKQKEKEYEDKKKENNPSANRLYNDGDAEVIDLKTKKENCFNELKQVKKTIVSLNGEINNFNNKLKNFESKIRNLIKNEDFIDNEENMDIKKNIEKFNLELKDPYSTKDSATDNEKKELNVESIKYDLLKPFFENNDLSKTIFDGTKKFNDIKNEMGKIGDLEIKGKNQYKFSKENRTNRDNMIKYFLYQRALLLSLNKIALEQYDTIVGKDGEGDKIPKIKVIKESVKSFVDKNIKSKISEYFDPLITDTNKPADNSKFDIIKKAFDENQGNIEQNLKILKDDLGVDLDNIPTSNPTSSQEEYLIISNDKKNFCPLPDKYKITDLTAIKEDKVKDFYNESSELYKILTSTERDVGEISKKLKKLKE